ncbi:MAG: hypothetical protein CMA53_00395 [Euryarchaeota archaeon]|jgi:hypothetical protein|nr:hypothetical protein [Euryarchaeota archaeon]|tara:strand:+ start:2918 stop:3709 length:792 start_codon:yes stop_codon:yes gene_type:complete
MATVRMSNELIKQLCEQFEKDYQNINPRPAVNDQESLGVELYDTFAKPLYEKVKGTFEELKETDTDAVVWDVKEHMKSVFNKESFVKAIIEVPEYHRVRKDYRHDGNELDYNLKHYTERYVRDDDHGMTKHQFNIDLPFEGNFVGDRYGGSCMNLSKASEHELTKKVYAAYKTEFSYDQTFADKKADFFDLLDRFQTLNQALKAWPQLANIVEKVAPSKMVTIHKKTERKKKQQDQAQYVEQNAAAFNNVILGSQLLGDDDDS